MCAGKKKPAFGENAGRRRNCRDWQSGIGENGLCLPFVRSAITRERTNMPMQGTRFAAMPARRPMLSARMPMRSGMTMAPMPETGSRIPMLTALICSPTPATASGFTPLMAKAKAKSARIAVTGVFACTRNRYRTVQKAPITVSARKMFRIRKAKAMRSLPASVAPHMMVIV